MSKMKLYSSSPIWVQNIICSIVGWRKKLIRSNNRKLSEVSNPQELDSFIKDKLIIISDFYSKNEFWNEAFLDLNNGLVTGGNIQNNWKKIPHTDKKYLIENSNQFNLSEKDTIEISTSGSSGASFTFLRSFEADSKMWSFFERFRERHGWEKRFWCGYFCSNQVVDIKQKSGPFWRLNFPGKQIIFSNFHLTLDSVASYVDCLNKKKPEWIHGFPSFLYSVSTFALQSGIKLEYQPKLITVGSENLDRQQKNVIESFFGNKVRDLYCQCEGVAMISECKAGNLHIEEDFSFVELENVGGDVYELVGTSFYNFSFPFIRYRTGDLVTYNGKKCDCGHLGRVINNIDGRKDDYILLNSGAQLGRLSRLFSGVSNIQQAQIKQNKDLAITIYVVKSTSFSDLDHLKLKESVLSFLGNDTEYKILYVTEIKKSKNGKSRLVIKE